MLGNTPSEEGHGWFLDREEILVYGAKRGGGTELGGTKLGKKWRQGKIGMPFFLKILFYLF